MRKSYTLAVLMLVCHLLVGQKLFLQGELVKHLDHPILTKAFNDYEIYKVDDQQMDALSRQRASLSHLQLQMGAHNWAMDVKNSEIKSENYTLVTIGLDRSVKRKSASENYIGSFEGGISNLTIGNNLIVGTISKGEEVFYIEPLKRYIKDQSKNYLIVYHQSDLKPSNGYRCGLTEMIDYGEENIQPVRFQQAALSCIQTDYALAADHSMYSKFDDVYDLEAYLLTILSLSQEDFTEDDFRSSIQFKVITTFISTCAECDPWVEGGDSEALLRDFGEWGNNGGFETDDFHLASLWTARVFNDSLAGLAWLEEMCSDFKYNILRDYTDNLGLLKTLQSHEIAHNFGAVHVRQADGTIMTPKITATNEWSIWTRLRINGTMNSFASKSGCLHGCDDLTPPVVAFSADVQSGCMPISASFSRAIEGEILNAKWIFEGGTPAISYEENPTVTYDQAGTYEVRLMALNTAGADTLIHSSFIEVGGESAPTLDIAYEIGRTEAAFLSENADSVFWDLGDGTTSTENQILHNYQEDGIYTITLITNSLCGIDTITQELKIITPPTAAFSAENTNGCSPLEVQFMNTSRAFEGDYLWEFEGGNPSISTEENPIITYDSLGSFQVKLTATNEAGVSEIIEEGVINVGQSVIADFEHEILGDTMVQFEQKSSFALNYQWDFGDGNTSTEANPAHTYQEAGEYEILLIAIGECEADTTRQTISIAIPSVPTALFSIQTPVVCSSQSLTLDGSESTDADSYFWFIPGARPTISMEKSPTFEFPFPGFYNVQLIVQNDFGRDTLLIPNAILILEAPEVDFTFQIGEDNATVNFRQNANTARMQVWDFGDGSSSTERNPTHVYATPGTYEILLTIENECGQDSIRQMINVGNVPTAPQAIFSIEEPVVCLSESLTLDASSSFAADTYAWSIPGATPENADQSQAVFQFPAMGNYDVQLIVTNEFGADTLLLENAVQVIDLPDAMFEFEVTQSDTIIQFMQTNMNAESVQWDFGDGNTSDLLNPIHAYDSSGIYEVTLAIENQCGMDSLRRLVSVGNVPNAPIAFFSLDNSVACVLDIVNFSAVESVGAQSYFWKFEGPNTITSNGETAVLVFSDPGFYDIELVVENAVGKDTLFVEDGLRIVDTPVANFTAELDKNIAKFNNLSIYGQSYFWDFGDGNTSTVANPEHAYVLEGDFVVDLLVINPCDTVTYSENITVESFFPRASFTASATGGCAPFIVSFVDGSSNAESYQWAFPGGEPEFSSDPNPVVTYTESGVYDVSLVVTNSSGRAILERTDYIEVFPSPEANYTFEVDSNLVTFTNTSINAESIEWVFDENNRSMLENPFFEFNQKGSYDVQLIRRKSMCY